MGSVTIRNLPDGVVAEIKAAAALHGRSLESELRELLQRPVLADALLGASTASFAPTRASGTRRPRERPRARVLTSLRGSD